MSKIDVPHVYARGKNGASWKWLPPFESDGSYSRLKRNVTRPVTGANFTFFACVAPIIPAYRAISCAKASACTPQPRAKRVIEIQDYGSLIKSLCPGSFVESAASVSIREAGYSGRIRLSSINIDPRVRSRSPRRI